MTKEIKDLLAAVKKGDIKEAQELADKLEPPEHLTERVLNMLGLYGYALDLPEVVDKNFHLTTKYKQVLNFMECIEIHDKVNILKVDEAVTKITQLNNAGILLAISWLVSSYLPFVQDILIPHLQEIGLCPSTQDTSDN